MDTLETTTLRRRLCEERKVLQQRLRQIDQQLRDLHALVHDRSEQSDLTAARSVAKRIIDRLSRRTVGRKANEIVLEILRAAHPEFMKASDIRAAAIDKFQADVNPNTITVSLSRFRTAGLVTLDRKAWAYVAPVRTNHLSTFGDRSI